MDEEDELPLGVEASINLDAFDPEDLDDEELVEGEDLGPCVHRVQCILQHGP